MAMLSGKHALVTGGGTGIGADIAIALVEAGAVVTIAGRRQAPLDELAGRNSGIRAAVADVTDEASVTALFHDAATSVGPLSIVVANAGMAESAPFARTSLDAFERIVAVNLTGVFLTLREAARIMAGAEWGRLIVISSIAGLRGYPYVAPYCAAKHGAVGLVRALATELPNNVTANAICPGYTETPMLEQSVRTIMEKTGRSDEEARKMLAGMNSGGRVVEPEEISDAVLKLCLPGSEAVNGEAIEIAGEERA